MIKITNKPDIKSFGITPVMLRDDYISTIILDGHTIPCIKIGGNTRQINEKRKSYTVNEYDIQCTVPDSRGEYLWFCFTTDAMDNEILYVTY